MSTTDQMRAVTVPVPGDADALRVSTVERPVPGEHEVLIAVAAAGVNGADLAQRRGRYPSPPGAPEWPGLEVSGTVTDLGEHVEAFDLGDEVCALLPGGGYAEYAAVHESLVLPVPHGVELRDAAGLPEAVATAWSNIALFAALQPGETLLVHGGSSGVGSMAILIGVALGARVVATAGSTEKVAFCAELGASAIDYTGQDFVAEVLRLTHDNGADVVLDMVGGDYLARDLQALALDGRIMVIADRGGDPAGFTAGQLMAKRAKVWATTLRSRPLKERAAIIAGVRDEVWPLIERGHVHPVIDSVFPLEEAADAHRLMESSRHKGKILLAVDTVDGNSVNDGAHIRVR